jgi:AraC family transcriptional regulator
MKENIHRQQINKAFEFFKDNLSEKISLEDIASKCGASQYHFIRIFNAYTGETPFNYLRRERVVQGLILLHETDLSVTEVAMNIGFDASSSFNKAIKKIISLNPSEFRNLGKDQRKDLIYSFSMTTKTKEIIMNFKMNLEPEFIQREEMVVYSTGATGGEFKDIAPIAWGKFLEIVPNIKEDLSQSEFLGIGKMNGKEMKTVCNYQAAISVPGNENFEMEGLSRVVLSKGKYAKFILKGTYDNLWIAFDKAFEVIGKTGNELADSPCIENYLNDPQTTPVDDLITEILIPIK